MAPAEPPSRRLLTELSDSDVERLTRVLMLHDGEVQNEAWFAKQETKINTLPKEVLGPRSGLGRALTRVSEAMDLHPTQKATLCLTHRRLEPHLIRRIFIHVSKEVTVRNSAISTCTNLPDGVALWLKRLQTINALWMSPELYRSAFDAMPWDERPEQIRSGCEACILSVIGGAPIMLLDLHNSALSREKKDAKRKPAIMRFTDHWLNHNGVKPPEKFFEIMKQIKTVRRAQLEARRARRDQRKRGTLKTNEFSAQSDVGNLGFTFADKPARKQFEDEEIAEGGEELIGIFYTDKLAHGNNRDIVRYSAQGMHPAFRASMVFEPTRPATGKSSHSVYDRNSSSFPKRANTTRIPYSAREDPSSDGSSKFPKYGKFRNSSLEQLPTQAENEYGAPRTGRPTHSYHPTDEPSQPSGYGGAYDEGEYIPPRVPIARMPRKGPSTASMWSDGSALNTKAENDRLARDRADAYSSLTGEEPEDIPDSRGVARQRHNQGPPPSMNNKQWNHVRMSSADSIATDETRWSAFR